LGDVLIVGLNDDASVARLKGSGRPFLSLDDRAGILAAFEFVDHLVVYESDEPTALIEALQPDILVKGGNYSQEEVVGADLVKQYGGEVHLITLTRDHSITELSQDIHRKLSNESLS
jgi:D-beta-D-heptose 7-phosphate kinase/D-beta-D-heptose 1-phosphate adenosyltransferase